MLMDAVTTGARERLRGAKLSARERRMLKLRCLCLAGSPLMVDDGVEAVALGAARLSSPKLITLSPFSTITKLFALLASESLGRALLLELLLVFRWG